MIIVRWLNKIFFFILFLIIPLLSFSQNLIVDIKILDVDTKGYQCDGKCGAGFRFYKDSNSDNNYLSPKSGQCLRTGINTFYTLNTELNSFDLDINNPSFTLVFESFNKRKEDKCCGFGTCGDGSDDCKYEPNYKDRCNKPDLYQLFSNYSIDFNDPKYLPGVYTPLTTENTGGGSYAVSHIYIRYRIPTPNFFYLNTSANPCNALEARICADKNVTLKTNVKLPPAANKSNLQYEWEYHIANDSTVTLNNNLITCIQNWNYNYGNYGNPTNQYATPGLDQCMQYVTGATIADKITNCGIYSFPQGAQLANCYLNNDRYNVSINWKPIGTSNTDSISFLPFSKLFNGSLSSAKNVYFRVKAKSSEIETEWVYFNSTNADKPKSSASGDYKTFLPPAPTVAAQDITTEASCNNKATGKIIVSNVVSYGQNIAWVLLNSANSTSCCDSKDTINRNKNCITDVFASGSAAPGATNFTITDIPSGTYTLKLIATGNQSACANKFHNITVPQIPALQVSSSNTNITCFGANDGSLTFAPLNGKSPYTITVFDQGGNTLFNQVSTGSTLSNLKPGKYKISITDFCQTITQNITIIEPIPVSIAKDQFGKEIIETNGTTCAYPGNGTMKVQSAGGSPTNAKYKYILYKYNFNKTDSTSYRTKNYDAADANNKQWLLIDLEQGKYNLYIYDAERNCKPFAKYFEISGLAPIVIKNVKTSNINCFGTNQGSIIITPFGGTGKYKYRIKNTGSGLVTDQLDSTFSNLYAGTYQITLLSGEPGCQDNYLYPSSIVISEADKIVISTSKTDIKCNGDNNATITATVQGGSGAFNYTWEKNINNQWSTFATDKLSLDKLSGGLYRLKVQDKNSSTCEIISDQIKISEPDPLLITAVKQIRPGCVSDHVYLKPILSGGILPYQTLYALDGVNYTPFDDNTLLSLGTYSIKATDGNNCSYTFPDPVKITENAVNITVKALAVCYKQANGKIKLTVEGGELPYRYSIDNGITYHDKPDFDNVATGSYNIIVKDNKGCSGTAIATIEQRKDKPEIDFLVSSLQNALDTIVVVDISRPLPDKVKWIFDKNTQVIDSVSTTPKIRFPNPGTYQVVMNASFGDCEYSLGETITIKPYDPNTPKVLLPGVRPIEVFSITPNPNTGEFTVKVTLVKSHALVILIYDVRGNEVYRKNWQDIKEINEAIKLPDSQSGAFLVRVITENDAKELKMIVNK